MNSRRAARVVSLVETSEMSERARQCRERGQHPRRWWYTKPIVAALTARRSAAASVKGRRTSGHFARRTPYSARSVRASHRVCRKPVCKPQR
eukprot:506199-Prymnesium_polylepis.1